MKNHFLFYLLFLLILLNACEQSDLDPAEQDSKKAETVLNQQIYDETLAKRGNAEGSDPFEILKVSQRGNQLYVKVSYSGGCEEHLFQAIWNGVALFTEPPTVPILLTHDDQDDMCDAILQETIQIDLNALLGSELTSGPLIISLMNGSSEQTINISTEFACGELVQGTLKNLTGLDGCGFVIDLENGSRLEPESFPTGFDPQDGEQVKFSYTALDQASICMTGQPVKIHCIYSQCEDGEKGVLKDLTGLDGCGFVIDLEDGRRIEPLGFPEGFTPIDGKGVRVAFQLVDQASICMSGEIVEIACISFLN